VTAYNSIEYVSMVICSLIAARIVTIRAFAKGVIAGIFITLVITLANGKFGTDYFTGQPVLIGYFGSKNQVGLNAEMGLYTSILFFFTAAGRMEKLVYSVVPSAVCALCLYYSHSATSIIAMVAVLGIGAAAYYVTKMPLERRKSAFIAISIFGLLALGIAIPLGGQDTILHSLGKDSTLTGRTYLWTQGIHAAMQNPILGDGFSAFWVPGRPLAERLWYEFEIFGRFGFHFHSVFIQSFVDLGGIGLCFIVYMLLSNCYKSIVAVLEYGRDLTAFFCLGMSFLFLIRGAAEVDIVGTFGIGPLLFFTIAPRLSMRRAAQPKTVASVSIPPALLAHAPRQAKISTNKR
jgi:exopolysaccharide production protein ExoQ